MKDSQIAILGVAGLGLALLFYELTQQDDPRPVPSEQNSEDVMGLSSDLQMRVNSGTMLDLDPTIHGWHPGYDPDPNAQPTTLTKVRYPAVPGGNMSNVMHKGWDSMINNCPPDYEWWLNPPEASVL